MMGETRVYIGVGSKLRKTETDRPNQKISSLKTLKSNETPDAQHRWFLCPTTTPPTYPQGPQPLLHLAATLFVPLSASFPTTL